MQIFHSLAARYALAVALAATAGLFAWAATDIIASREAPPESVMGPGYNAPPPVIPVS
jgi:hypothetical protein